MCMYQNTKSALTTELLDGCLWNLVGMKCSWHSHAWRCFGQIYPRADPGQGENRWRGAFSRKYFFRLEGYSNKPNVYQWSRSMWDEVLLFFVPFRSQFFLCVHCFRWAFWASCFFFFLLCFTCYFVYNFSIFVNVTARNEPSPLTRVKFHPYPIGIRFVRQCICPSVRLSVNTLVLTR